MYSSIFENKEDVRNHPFLFEDTNLGFRKNDDDYDKFRIKGYLMRPKKNSALTQEAAEEMRHQLEPIKQDIEYSENIIVENPDEDSQKEDDDGKTPPNFKRRFYVQSGHQLIEFKREGDPRERGKLNIKFARLRKTSLRDGDTKLHGFVLMAKGVRLHFYAEDEEAQGQWLNALRQSCVLLDVKDEYEIGRMLGRGNFARVHACVHKADPEHKEYALKTI